MITGIPSSNQRISLFTNQDDAERGDAVLGVLEEDGRPLGFYGVRDWQVLKVDDTNPSTTYTGQLTDVSQVDKFEMTDEAYAQRNGKSTSNTI